MIEAALATLRDPSADIDDVWAALHAAFNTKGGTWKPQGKRASTYMQHLRDLCLGEAPVLGLTIHQSKGLEWDRVLLLNGELHTEAGCMNQLVRDIEDHRSVYVGLTRARSTLRVLAVPVDRFSERAAIARVPISE